MPRKVNSKKTSEPADSSHHETQRPQPARNLLERIYRIRNSEKELYGKVRSFFARSNDYKSDSEESRSFFQRIQNKLLWAVSGLTSTGLLRNRSNAASPHLGLSYWYNAKVNKSDVTVGKNYLTKEEILSLKRKMVGFLKYGAKKAEKHPETDLTYWEKKVDNFFEINPETFPEEDAATKEGVRQAVVQRYEAYKAAQTPKQSEADKPSGEKSHKEGKRKKSAA